MTLTAVEQSMEHALASGFVVAGRTFRRPATTTFAHDAYTMKQLHGSGLFVAMQNFDMLQSPTMDELTTAIVIEAFSSGKLFQLLAAVLVEDGVKWSPAVADDVAMFFENLTDIQDKATLREAIPWVLLNFFIGAEDSWRIFLKSSKSDGRMVKIA